MKTIRTLLRNMAPKAFVLAAGMIAALSLSGCGLSRYLEKRENAEIMRRAEEDRMETQVAELSADNSEAGVYIDDVKDESEPDYSDVDTYSNDVDSNSSVDDASANDTNETNDTNEVDETSDEETKTFDFKFRSSKLLNQHYEKHGIEMGFSSAEDYEAAASAVVNNPDSLHKTEKEDGDYVFYLEKTNEFVVVSTDGFIRTYFLPDKGKAYYDKQ